MSALLESPRVIVHVGDGFKFLETHEATYDVIITDSSDPVGPAKSLFQKPYFQLLHDALAPGGHISTQGECLWLHLPLIRELRLTTQDLFATTEYAYTTIPTYPSGQIGFIVCAKAPGRDLKIPVRDVQGTRYYNKDLHRSAFNLPEFAKAFLEQGEDLRPKFGRELLKVTQKKPEKRILLLGSGFVARPCAEYLVRDPSNHLTVACRTLESAQALGSELPNTSAILLDVNNTTALEEAVAKHDIVVSLIPYTYHATVIKAAIKAKVHVVTTSYVSPAMRELDAAAKEAGIVVFNEIGLDPGIDHLYAVKTIAEVHDKGGKVCIQHSLSRLPSLTFSQVKEFHSYCGGLPAPQCSDNPLGYKFSWSSRGVLLALINSASCYIANQKVTIPGSKLMGHARPYYIAPAFAFVAYPNRDSTPFREFYNIPEAETIVRGTLRYQGFPEFVKALLQLGWLDAEEKDWLKNGITWAEATQRLTEATGASEK